ncbi:acyl-CoA thioesterase [Sulfurimonas sp.]|nr:acyl-CoA thioesterase [Sulfurimonas sp.]
MRTLSVKGRVYPTDLNHNGGVFGGWIMGKMDKAASIAVDEILKSGAVTVSVTDLHFKEPVSNGDIFYIYTEIVKIGRSSIVINVDFKIRSIVEENELSEIKSVVDAKFTFVAVENKKSVAICDVLRPDASKDIIEMAYIGKHTKKGTNPK